MIKNGKEILLSFKEITEQYKVSLTTLWRHEKKGTLPVRMRHNRPFVPRSFVQKNYQIRTNDESRE